MLRLLEPIYLGFLSGTIIDWLVKSTNSLTALLLGIVTVVYMFFKAYNEYLEWKKKKNERT